VFERLGYKLRNYAALLRSYKALLGAGIAANLGAVAFTGILSLRHYIAAESRWVDLGMVSARVVTDAGVAFLVDDWDNSVTDITTFNFHDSGTGVTAEAQTQTALVTPCGEARDAGTKSQPTAPQIRTVATHTYAGTFAITEHGIFSAATVGTMWDRSLFAAINVVANDKIEFTYTLTVNANG